MITVWLFKEVSHDDLRLDALYVLYVVYPGDTRYVVDDRIVALPARAPFSMSDTGPSVAYPVLPR